jgi:hypothetical protein
MKVRHKRNSNDERYHREVVDRYGPYYICKDVNIGPLVALPVEDYEPVPSETWRDVTGEFLTDDKTPYAYTAGSNQRLIVVGTDMDSYRVARRILRTDDPRDQRLTSAFIIKRKD